MCVCVYVYVRVSVCLPASSTHPQKSATLKSHHLHLRTALPPSSSYAAPLVIPEDKEQERKDFSLIDDDYSMFTR